MCCFFPLPTDILKPRFTKYEDMKIVIQLISKQNHPYGKSPYKKLYTCGTITAHTNIDQTPFILRCLANFHPMAHLFEFGPPSVYFTCRVIRGAQELNTSYNRWENEHMYVYIYIMTYQESDQILSTNRFRHHDYDHDTENDNVEG